MIKKVEKVEIKMIRMVKIAKMSIRKEIQIIKIFIKMIDKKQSLLYKTISRTLYKYNINYQF